MSSISAAVGPMTPQLLDGNSLYRRVMITPSACGHNCLFLAHLGDWTWEAISTMSHTDIFREKNEDGDPVYPSAFYLRVCGSPAIQMHHFTFGDVIDVVTSVFNFGSQSLLVLHRVERAPEDGAPPRPVDPSEFHERRDENRLYVQLVNRWIARSRKTSNEELFKSAPERFATRHLPVLPDRYSPRLSYDLARRAETFHDVASPDYEPVVEEFAVDYTIDAARDLNGVGLVYFASFQSIVDSALLKLWRHLGRDVHSFINRVVRDRQAVILSNAEIDSDLRLILRSWRRRDDPRQEVFNVVIRHPARDRAVVVSTLQIQSEAPIHASV